jgi:hypothetical protein
MKILERQNRASFGHPPALSERVTEWPDGSPLPAGAQPVPEATPLQDWGPQGSAFIAPEPEAAEAEKRAAKAKKE